MVLRQSTIFTAHAFDRVNQRLTLSHDDVAAILDNDLAVSVGVDPFSNRLRRVFYSIPDEQFFVAVQDVNAGAVVTVLPLEYHANLRWPIREKKLVEAARRVGAKPPDLGGVAGVVPKVPRTALRISCSVVGTDGIPRFRNLGSWPAGTAPEDLALLAHDETFMEAMLTRLQTKGVSEQSRVTLHVRLGKDGDRVDIEVNRGVRPAGDQFFGDPAQSAQAPV